LGIVLKQSFRNTLILILGFTIGGANVLFLYTDFLEDEYYGLIVFLLSTSALLLPLLVYGMQHAVVKYFSSYQTKIEKDSLLTWSLIVPLLIIIPTVIVGVIWYEGISNWISRENILIKNYTYIIFLVALFMGYFEVFYSWTKVHFNSVFGNFIKEIFARVGTTILLVSVYNNWLTPHEFVYGIVLIYFLRMLVMIVYAFSVYTPKFTVKKLPNFKEVLGYAVYLILAGSAGSILLEIDKFMIPQAEQLPELAYYAVGVFIASTIGIPNRAMQQITSPITAKGLNNNDLNAVFKLYRQSSINLLIVGGLLFLLINLNIVDIYRIINKPQYSVGVWIVLFISISELYKLALGTNGTILTNSKYYKVFFYISLGMAGTVIILNHYLINLIGINGAALATLLTILIFNTVKIWYVKKKMDMQPFTKKSVLVLGVILSLYLLWYTLEITAIPMANIMAKSILISLVYGFLIYILKISEDLNLLVNQFLNRK
jgi:O-antigen/teichoic acid export membrane protein